MSNRFLLYIAFTLVLFMIWQQWKIEQNPPGQNQNTSVKEESLFEEQDLPEVAAAEPNTKKTQDKNIGLSKDLSNANGDEIVISNDDIEIIVDTLGGTIKEAKLLKYFKTTDPDSKNIKLLDYQNDFYIAQSGLLHDKNSNNKNEEKLAPNHYDLFKVKSKNNDSITLEWTNPNQDITVLKKIYLNNAGYEINIENTIINKSKKAWAGRQYRQIRRKSAGEGRSWVTPTFTGGAYYDGTYNKISYSEISEKKPKFNVQSGWVAMMEHYFVSAWFFPKDENNLFYTKEIYLDDSRRDYIIGARSEAVLAQPSESVKLKSNLYVGPKLQKELEKLADGLELTIDYGVLTFISKPLFWLLDKIYSFIGNWGWAIILLTLLIKLAFYKLSETSYKSMAKMKQFSPKIQSIRERYGSDRQKMNQAMMDMYRQEKINPLGGCWPILIQIPVFIALYWVLLESVELRQADFIFWLNDLSAKDPYYVLPLIMGASMYFQQKLNPTPPDPMQAKVMQMLPIIFTAFFAFFPSGLVLYWVVNNLLSIAQQWKITKAIASQ
ncbi:MAG: membrane protein insertase YidC [Flammeovirgaceae bacterium]|nr:membrane protein insertase YidC [Flammeovirgaceae bacterium]